jgi:A/G-specific adenine glycosylase
VFNAATMELGATVCLARVPRCGECPVADGCAWRLAGYPDTGDTRRRQAAYEGSDRQARGAVLRVLREAPGHATPLATVIADWPDGAQRERAIGSLVSDGLAELADGVLRLPSAMRA